MTGLPAGIKFEALINSTWTDINTYVAGAQATGIKFGRQSEYTVPSAATLSLTLFNDTAAWMPFRQVLNTGAANPFWPYVVPGMGIRYSYTIAAVTYYRFVGVVQSFQPTIDSDGTNPQVVISAVDQLQHLANVTLKSPLMTEGLASSAVHLWPMTEPAGSVQAIDSIGRSHLTASTGAALAFGDNGPGSGNGSGVKFSPASATDGQVLTGAFTPGTQPSDLLWSLELWVNTNAALPAWGTGGGAVQNIAGMDSAVEQFRVYLVNGVLTVGTVSASLTGPSFASSSEWHQVVLNQTSSPLNITDLYVDGAFYASISASMSVVAGTVLTVGDVPNPGIAFAGARFQGNVGFVGYYGQGAPLTAAQIAEHYLAGHSGYTGDRTDQRIARWLTSAGYTAADWDLDVGVAIVGSYPQDGKSVFDACQDMATTEGGGAAFYQTPDGKLRFANRNYRNAAAPKATIDAGGDFDASTYAASLDTSALANHSTVSRATESGTQSTQVWLDAASIAVNDEYDDDVTTYATSDADALYLAQYRVASKSQPGFRMPQIGIDLLTATTAGLYAAIAGIQIGDRVRVNNMDSGTAPVSVLDSIVEGWTETVGIDQYSISFDGTAADNPAFGLVEDAVYGRAQAQGMTVAAMTNSTTTMVITTSAGNPCLTVNAAMYPIPCVIGEEVMSITAAPASAVSPQTVTVVRAQHGTPAAAHAASSAFDVWPTATAGL